MDDRADQFNDTCIRLSFVYLLCVVVHQVILPQTILVAIRIPISSVEVVGRMIKLDGFQKRWRAEGGDNREVGVQ